MSVAWARGARRWWPLATVATVVVGLALAGVLPRWPGLAQEVALPPLDLLTDIRVLVAEAPSPVVFVAGLAAALTVRVIMLTLLLGRSLRRPGFALRFYAVAMPPGLVAAALDVSARAVLYAYLLWAGLLVTLVAFVALAAAPWTGLGGLRGALARAWHDRLRIAALVPYLFGLAVLGAVVRRPGEAIQVVVVPASALLTAAAATRLSAAPARRVSGRAVAAIVTAVLATGVVLVAVARGDRGAPPRPPPREGSLLLVAGVDTSSGAGALYRLDPRALGYSCAQTSYFSYAGTGSGTPQRDATCPIRRGAPYRRADTLRPLPALAETFRHQVAALPRPVTVVTHSQGAWIAWAALSPGRATGVRGLVMLGPFSESLAAYPPPGRGGRGAVAGVAVRAVTDLGAAIGFSTFDPDAPLARQLQATPGAVEALLDRPLSRQVRVAAVLSRWDLPLVPGGWPRGVSESCPGWSAHGGLPSAALALDAASRFLEHRTPGDCPVWVRALGHATQAFGAPPPHG